MTNEELADEIIRRLNDLIANDDVRKDVGRLLSMRIPCSEETVRHETIQVNAVGPSTLSFLGILNGLVGCIQEGSRRGWGHVTAEFTTNEEGTGGELVRFIRTEDHR